MMLHGGKNDGAVIPVPESTAKLASGIAEIAFVYNGIQEKL